MGGILDGRDSQKGDFGVFFLLHTVFSIPCISLLCSFETSHEVAKELETQHKTVFAESLNSLVQISSSIISEYFHVSILQKSDALLHNIST